MSCSNALRELILKEIWRLLDGEPGISGALDNRVQVTGILHCRVAREWCFYTAHSKACVPRSRCLGHGHVQTD